MARRWPSLCLGDGSPAPGHLRQGMRIHDTGHAQVQTIVIMKCTVQGVSSRQHCAGCFALLAHVCTYTFFVQCKQLQNHVYCDRTVNLWNWRSGRVLVRCCQLLWVQGLCRVHLHAHATTRSKSGTGHLAGLSTKPIKARTCFQLTHERPDLAVTAPCSSKCVVNKYCCDC